MHRPRHTTAQLLLALLLLASLLLALPAGGAADPPPATHPPTPLAVIAVEGEVYRVELSAPGAVEGARALLAGTSIASIPVSEIVRDDPGPNAPWSWHIDPESLAWAEVAIEVCDGLPTHIEDGVLTIDQYCPWGARLLAIDGDPGAPPPLPPGDPTALPLTASGGTSLDDRTFARRVVLEAGEHRLGWTTGAQVDASVSTCPIRFDLRAADGTPVGWTASQDLDAAPDDEGELVFGPLAAGAYDLFWSVDCAWTIRLERGTSTTS
jgi:hypothetical protein